MMPGRPPSFWHSSPMCRCRLLKLRWHAWGQVEQRVAEACAGGGKARATAGRAEPGAQAGCGRCLDCWGAMAADDDGGTPHAHAPRAGAKHGSSPSPKPT